jgi:serine/threonine protein kinase/WD40 repeat protein
MSAPTDRIQAVFLEVVAIVDPTARAARLSELCGDDKALHRRVEALLAAHDAPGTFLKTPGPESLETTSLLVPDAAPGVLIANRYKLLEQIGEGGMGVVWMAEQRTPVRRLVALKLIKAGMDSKAVLARFEAERQALAMMDHTSIARVFDGGVTEHGHPWFAMELVRGLPLNEYCDQRRMPIPERLELFMQVCSAAQHAHQKGIIHRDLKPSNVLVTEVDGEPLPKVIDFGLAKALGGGIVLTERTLHTSYGAAAGTLLYMAPEQAAINALDVDTRADVYALGVLLYELLTGTTPLERQRFQDAAWDEMRRMLREEDPQLPSLRISKSGALADLAATRHADPARLSGMIKGDLDWIVMKALEKDRNRRYASAASFADDVRRHLDQEPVEAAPPSLVYRAGKIWRRHRTPLVAAATTFAVLLGSVILISSMAVQKSRALKVAEAAKNSESEQRVEAESAKDRALAQSYINSIIAAQNAIENNNWTEARLRLDECDSDSRGWEWQFLRAYADAPEFGLSELVNDCQISHGGRYVLTSDEIWRPDYAFTRSSANRFVAVDAQTGASQGVYVGRGVEYEGDADWRFVARAAISDDGHVAIQDGRKFHIYRFSEKIGTVDLSHLDFTFQIKVRFSPTGAYLVIIKENDCYLYAVRDLRGDREVAPVGKVLMGEGPEEQPFFSADESELFVVSPQSSVARHSIAGAKLADYVLKDSKADVTALALSSDGNKLAIGTSLGAVEVFECETRARIAELSTGKAQVERLAFNPVIRDVILVGSGSEKVEVWNTLSATNLGTLRKNSQDAFFTKSGGVIAGFSDGTLWRWQDGDSIADQDQPTGDANIVAYTPDAATAISIDAGKIRFWKTEHRNRQPAVQEIPSTTPSDEPHCFMLADMRCPFDSWGPALAQTAQIVAEYAGALPARQTAAADPGGKWTARIDRNSRCEIVNSNQESIVTLPANIGAIRSVVATQDGNRLITGGDDGAVRFWDTVAWKEVAVFRRESSVTDLILSSDGKRLIVLLAMPAVEVWDWRSESERAAAERDSVQQMLAATQFVNQRLPATDDWRVLAAGVLQDAYISPTRRVAILSEIHAQVENQIIELEDAVATLKNELMVEPIVAQKLTDLPLTPTQRKRADELLLNWEPTEDETRDGCLSLAEKADAERAALEQARAIMKEFYAKTPRVGFKNTIAAIEYRLGNYAEAVKLFREKGDWIADENRVRYWNAFSRDMAFLAMAEHKLGNGAEAKRLLHTSLHHWFWDDVFNELQSEAATLICPTALATAEVPRSEEWKAVQALDAADLAGLEKTLGEEITIKGRVARVSPTAEYFGANVILHPLDKGVILWIRFAPEAKLDWTFAKALDGQEIVVSGVLKRVPESTKPLWQKERLEIEIVQPEDVTIIQADPPVINWWSALESAPSTRDASSN